MGLHGEPVTIDRADGDDPAFLETVQRALTHFVRAHAPDDVFLVRIDRWFGDDLLPTVTRDGTTRLAAFRAEHVISEARYEKDETGAYPEAPLQRPIHPPRDAVKTAQHAETLTESGLFFWFSGESAATRRGSIMLLELREGARGLACIQFGKNGSWRISRVEGLDRATAEKACGLRGHHS